MSSSSSSTPTGIRISFPGGWLENRFPSEVVRTIRRLMQSGVGKWSSVPYVANEVKLRVPQLTSLVTALLPMLPQLQSNSRVIDIQSISAQLTQQIVESTLKPSLTLLTDLLKSDFTVDHTLQIASLPATTDSKSLPKAENSGYDLVLSFLGLQEWLESCTSLDSSSFHLLLQSWFDRIYASLSNGGHLFIASSDDARVSLFEQLQMVNKAGFADIDVVCKQEGFYVFGARKMCGSQFKLDRQRIESSSSAPCSNGGEPTFNVLSNSSSLVSTKSSGVTLSSSNSNSQSKFQVPMNSPQTSYSSPIPEANMQPHASAALLSDPSSQPSASNSSSFARELPPSLLAKVPLLFRRFDPANSGRLAYSQLEALCRAVGRKIIDSEADDDNGESLWWVYQSVASEDRETGCTGIAIEDLINHFYVTNLWDLQHDLTKLRIV